MRRSTFALTAAVGMVVGTIGCEVREEPRPRRHVVVY